MNIDITGNFFPGKNTNYENHYDEKTQLHMNDIG